MTKKIRDKLIEAYSHFSEGIHEGRYESAKMFGEEIKGIRVSLEDYKMLKPFVQAHSMKVFNVNGIELKLSYGASFYSVEDNDGVLLCAVKEEAILEA
ncbi:MAG: hypothetical protein J6U74_02015, partial [Clostridia bacterium]|nr:hypothetical protein [Clostridia bacterium]